MSDPVRVGEDLEGIRARIEEVRRVQRNADRVPPQRLYDCVTCLDTGWEQITGLADGASIGTVRRCPNRCPLPKVKQWDVPSRPARVETEVF